MRTRRRIIRSPIGRGLVWLLVIHMGLLHVAPVLALPQGQEVAHGNVTFETSGDTMVVQQASGSAIVNYTGFDIAQPETVQFIQPGSSAAILNRVHGGSSTIAGALQANGRVYLINPNGILFTSSARVNVGGLVASALNLSDSDFLSGNLSFSGGSGSVVNEGSISAGFAYLIGGNVENSGSIRAGDVALAAGGSVVIDRAAGGEIRLIIDNEEQDLEARGWASGLGSNVVAELDSRSTASGGASADGTEEPAAEGSAGETGPQTAALASDIVEAQPAGDEPPVLPEVDPALTLAAQLAHPSAIVTNGLIINLGTIDASGETGGRVAVRGLRVGHYGTVSADGSAGDGGRISLYADELLLVDSGSETTANAADGGDGGEIFIFGEQSLVVETGARAQAYGGTQEGDKGGTIEVSTSNGLQLGVLDNEERPGAARSVLVIDPHNFVIGDGSDNDLDGKDDYPPPITAGLVPTSDDSWMDIDTFEDILDEYGLMIARTDGISGGSEQGDIKLQSSIDYDGIGSDGFIYFRAQDDVRIWHRIRDSDTDDSDKLTLLIEALDDMEDDSVRNRSHRALQRITSQAFGMRKVPWARWWKAETERREN